MATRVPELQNQNLIVRLAKNLDEVRAANRLLVNSYLDVGLFEDEKEFLRYKFRESPLRTVFVMLNGEAIVGTVSLISDSEEGLPADKFDFETMHRLRATSQKIAEVGALAIDRDAEHQRTLVLFLFSFLYQYGFYYMGADRFVATATPKHAYFYEKICCFEKVTTTAAYHYVKLDVQLVSLPLVAAQKRFSERYARSGDNGKNLYRFMIEENPNFLFPDEKLAVRSRQIDWANVAVQAERQAA